MNVWVGVLAAGEGRRMGSRPKALLKSGGKTFLETIAESAREAGVQGIAAVIGYHAEQVEPVASEVCDVVVTNPTPEQGMGSSARALATGLPHGASMLLWPVDIPHIRSQTLKAIIAAAVENPKRLIVPKYQKRGHPPLLPPQVVESLRALPNDARLDVFLDAMAGTPLLFVVDDPAVEQDVDSPLDLELLQRQPNATERG